LLSVDGGFGIWRDVGLDDEFVGGLAIASLFAIVQDVDVEPGGWGGQLEMKEQKGGVTFYRHPR
jgi:hypothetical protein